MIPDPLTEALIARLVQLGVLDADDIEAMAQILERQDEHDAARICRASLLRAIEPSQSEWDADRARSRFRVFGPDGGNDGAD